MSAKLFLIMQLFSFGETLLEKTGNNTERQQAIKKLKKSVERMENKRGR